MAVKVMRIATGEEEEDVPSPASAAATLGRLSGGRCAGKKALTPGEADGNCQEGRVQAMV